MQVRCPHCQSPVDVTGDASLEDITCSSCGSSFSLLSGGETVTFSADAKRTLSHFELGDCLGTGANGSVWKAHDTELDRTVAIKIPHRVRLNRPDADRFFREARTAAQLKHPGIVGVHEIGSEDDTVFIVTDYVEGANLKEWLSARRLTPREAAGLCVKLAEALHHAHEAGVVHRDLKPGNVMMTADGEPRIMDFGLAKRDAGEITMTVEGRILGTPAYMSPEQARGEGHAADRCSDVYSLGVILFELLTGELPFRGEKQMLIVQILNDDPPSPRKLNSHVPRDLETICLKCLEKVATRRYQTAQELVDDLRRYVNNEPINAHPIGRVQKAWRWCRRKPALAGFWAVLTILLSTLAIGGPVVAWNQAELRRQADKAGEQAAENTRQNRRLSYQLTVVSDELANELLSRIDAKVPGATRRAESLFRRAHQRIMRLAEVNPESTEAQFALSISFERLGNIRMLTGDLNSARLFLEKSLAIRERLVRIEPSNAERRRGLSGAYQTLGDLALRLRDTQSAATYYRKQLTTVEQTARIAPADLQVERDLSVANDRLGDVSSARGDSETARGFYERSLEIRERLAEKQPNQTQRQQDLAISCEMLGNVAFQRGDAASAVDFYRRGHEIVEKLADRDPANFSFQRHYSVMCNKLGDALLATRKTEQARDHYEQALRIREKLAKADPQNFQLQRDLAVSYEKLGRISLLVNQLPAARGRFESARAIRRKIADLNPRDRQAQRDLGLSYLWLGDVDAKSTKLAAARRFYQEAYRIFDRLSRGDPEDFPAARDLFVILEALGGLEEKAANFEQAILWYRRGLAVIERDVVKSRLATHPYLQAWREKLRKRVAFCRFKVPVRAPRP